MTVFIKFILSAIGPWTASHLPKAILIAIAAILVSAVGRFFIERTVRKVVTLKNAGTRDAEKKREDTLIAVFAGTLRVIVWIIASLMIIGELGLDVAPMLATAGVAGLALGFGAQYMIRDVISGLFIIFENQYRVGDVVCVDATCGLVESINLRVTVLRDMDATVHYIPNGQIQKASNMSKNYSRVNLNIGISYNADLQKVVDVVNRVGNEIAADPIWKDSITSAPQFLRIDDFGDSAIIIKILGETLPIKQWDVTGELRKRLKLAFDKEGIEIPYPQIVVHQAS